jgi:hypothetical protein
MEVGMPISSYFYNTLYNSTTTTYATSYTSNEQDIYLKLKYHFDQHPDIPVAIKISIDQINDSWWVEWCKEHHVNRWRVFKAVQINSMGVILQGIDSAIIPFKWIELL